MVTFCQVSIATKPNGEWQKTDVVSPEKTKHSIQVAIFQSTGWIQKDLHPQRTMGTCKDDRTGQATPPMLKPQLTFVHYLKWDPIANHSENTHGPVSSQAKQKWAQEAYETFKAIRSPPIKAKFFQKNLQVKKKNVQKKPKIETENGRNPCALFFLGGGGGCWRVKKKSPWHRVIRSAGVTPGSCAAWFF